MYVGSIVLYSIYTIVTVVAAYIAQREKNKLIALVAFLFIILFWGIRKDIGFDYDGYVNIFIDIQHGSSSYVEIGYYYLNYLFQGYKDGYIGALILACVITYFFLFKAFWTKGILWQGVFFSIVFQFQFMAANQVRQAIAIAFFLFLLKYIEKRAYIKYIIGVLVAMLCFHTSAVCLILAIPFSFLKFRREIWCVTILGVYLLYLLGFFKMFGNYLFGVLPVPEQYTHYLLGSRVDAESVGFSLVQLSNVVVALYLVWHEKYIPTKSIIPIYMSGVLMYIVFVEYHLFLRMSFYFLYINMILAALLCVESRSKGIPLLIFCGLLFLLICAQSTNMHGVIPYQSWL